MNRCGDRTLWRDMRSREGRPQDTSGEGNECEERQTVVVGTGLRGEDCVRSVDSCEVGQPTIVRLFVFHLTCAARYSNHGGCERDDNNDETTRDEDDDDSVTDGSDVVAC